MSAVSAVTGVLVILVAALSAGHVHATLSGFPDLSDLQRDAAQIYHHTVRYEQVTLFPTITFTCSGRVTNLTFMAASRNSGTRDPQFQIWSRDNDGGRYRRECAVDIRIDQITKISTFVFTFSPESMDFSDGDYLGLYQPSEESRKMDLFLQEGGGPENVYVERTKPVGDIRFTDNSNDLRDYPLVSVQTDPPGCADGFLTTESLKTFVEVRLQLLETVSFEREQRVIPDINFTCTATLNKWTVAGQIGEGSSHPELQVWRPQRGSMYGRVKSFPLVGSDLQPRSDQRNVYDFIPVEEVTISSGSVLGLFQPALDQSSFIVYYQSNSGPQNYGEGNRDAPSDDFRVRDGKTRGNNYPLVTVDLASADCATGFISADRLAEQALFLATFADVYSQQRIIPAMNITQDGLLTKWTFAARNLGEAIERTEYPELQILRLNSGDTYDIVHKTDSSEQPSRIGFLNIYEYLPNPPLRVRAGDILGFRQPPESSSRFELAVIEGAGPPNEIVKPSSRKRQINVANDLPLILVDIGMLPPSPTLVSTVMTTESVTIKTSTAEMMSSSPSPVSTVRTNTDHESVTSETPTDETGSSMSHPQPTEPVTVPEPTSKPSSHVPSPDSTASPSPSIGPEGGEESSSPAASVAGAIVGVLVAIGVIAATVIIVVCVLRKKRTENSRTPTRSKRFSEHILDNPIYASVRGYTNGSHYAASSEMLFLGDSISSTPNTTTHENDSESIYAIPDVTSGSGERNGVDNPEYMCMHPQEAHCYGSGDDYESSLFPGQVSPSDPMNHYEWDISVPTKQQCTEIPSVHEESIYSTVEEAQQCGNGDTTSFFTESETYWTPAKDEDELYQQLASNKYREIPRPQINTQSHLGSGQFGTVCRGVWHSPMGGVEVAVKMLQKSSTEDQVKFLQEAAINGQFRHPNVVKLHGVVTVGEPVMIVLELLTNGDLRQFLTNQQPDPGELVSPDMPNTLLRFCKEIASGMQYLSGKAFVHRDLAARNILVAEDKTCKISDFGMSRDLEDENYYVSNGGKIPVKWTAPEALHFKKYSTASDVWSFGVVMYEIWSLGCKPFEGYSIVQVIRMLDGGCRLPPPPGCPREIYKLMISCWNPDKSQRPTFTQLLQELSRPEAHLLIWSEEDRSVHQQAAVLGAPLEAGKELYPELQNSYKKQ